MLVEVILDFLSHQGLAALVSFRQQRGRTRFPPSVGSQSIYHRQHQRTVCRREHIPTTTSPTAYHSSFGTLYVEYHHPTTNWVNFDRHSFTQILHSLPQLIRQQPSNMSVVSLLGVNVLNNPAKFGDSYNFEITFECLESLEKGQTLPLPCL